MVAANQRVEALGPAERIINTVTQYVDHMTHNRSGIVVQDGRQRVGVRWEPAIWVDEGGQKVVYKVTGKARTKLGVGRAGTDEVRDGARVVGRFRKPGLFEEVVAHLYEQVAEVWKLDNEFAARWASWSYNNDNNRDIKVLLAAFLLVQNRFGEISKDGDEKIVDDDYRAVGEAMCLLRSSKKGGTFNPKLLLRIGKVLETPGVIELNRKLGFGQTARRAIVGRYNDVLKKWLWNCEMNPKVLENLVKGGFRRSVMEIAQKIRYKPKTERFFEVLRWKQEQCADGHRTIALGKKVKKADSWDGLTEKQICQKIVKEKPNYKIIAGKLPAKIGLTPAIMAAAIQAGCLSDADLIILTPTLEELGLLQDKDVQARWKTATEKAENQRAANVARNVKSKEVKEELAEAADKATAKAVEAVTRDLRIYVVVDKSGSMEGAIAQAKEYLAKFVGAFALDRLHVSVFNTVGVEVNIKTPTAKGVEQAFRGHTAGGGTSYAEGVRCLLRKYKPAENEDALVIFVGDQEDGNWEGLARVFGQEGVQPAAFGLLHVSSQAGWHGGWAGQADIVERAATSLKIPCFKIDKEIFSDPYAVPRTIRNLIATTPVTKSKERVVAAPRVSLIEQILNTPLLVKPAWA